MAEGSAPEERTEMPTGRRIGQLRKQGFVPLSQEVVMVVTMMFGFFMIRFAWEYIYHDMIKIMTTAFGMIGQSEPLSIKDFHSGFVGIIWILAPKLLLMLLLISVVATLAVMLQTDWNIKEGFIKLDFPKLNPIDGIKKLFSMQNWANTLKAIAKLLIILPIGYHALKKFAPEMIGLIHTSVDALMTYTGEAMADLFWQIMKLLIVMAIIDYFWTKHIWLKNAKMTKDEVKDEKKSVDGDEQTKRKIQAKGLRRIAQRIRNSVPQADVVITNPTHYAIALKYDRDSMDAPTILAKGQGFLALKIREIAKESRVPIVERKPLARALYSSGEVGKPIPYELFRAVAEVIAYVYKLKNPWGYAQNQGRT